MKWLRTVSVYVLVTEIGGISSLLNFVSHFSQAGINQSLHQLTMEVSVDVAVLVLGETGSFTINSEVVVAETVIVGDVPQTFLQTGGNP